MKRRSAFINSSSVVCFCGRLLSFDAAQLMLFCAAGCTQEATP